MAPNFLLVFDEIIAKQLQKAAKNEHVRSILRSMLDELEDKGAMVGKLLDSHLFIYELKKKHPPIRLYFKHNKYTNEIYVFEYEMKTNEEKQRRTIAKIRLRVEGLKAKVFSGKLFSLGNVLFKIQKPGIEMAMP